MSQRQRGFTLMELMIVVAIVGILAGIGYPSYLAQMQKSRRTEAKLMLMNIANAEERYFLNNSTYTADLTATGLNLSATSENGYYTVAMTGVTVTTFTATATPVTTGPQGNDTDCWSFSIDQMGNRTAQDQSSNPNNNCWK